MKNYRKSIRIKRITFLLCMIALSSAPVFAAWPHLIFPSAKGITLVKGETYTIRWGSVRTDPVNIVLCEDLPDETFCFYAIARDVPNSESYPWTVPGDLPDASHYVIGVGVLGVSIGFSDHPFTISGSSPGQSPGASVDEVRLIARLYSAAFNREPKIEGLNFWVNSFESGKSITQIAKEFYQSPEFTVKYGALTDEAYIKQLFKNVLGREGAQGGIDFWKGNIAGGTSRAKVLEKFADSPENVNKTDELFGPMRFEGGLWVWECCSNMEAGVDSSSALIGSWLLTSVNGGAVAAGTYRELKFTESTVTVTSELDCEEVNHYSVDGNILTVTVTHQNGSQCGNNIGDSFSASFSVLNNRLAFDVIDPDVDRTKTNFVYTRN